MNEPILSCQTNGQNPKKGLGSMRNIVSLNRKWAFIMGQQEVPAALPIMIIGRRA